MRDIVLGGFTLLSLAGILFGSYLYAVDAGLWPTWAPGGKTIAVEK